MKTRLFLLSSLCLLPVAFAAADDTPPPEPPPVSRVDAPPAAPAPAAEEQKLYAPSATLIAPEQARAIIDKFKDAYAKLGNPRLLIYVNRELVDPVGGFKLAGRTEHTEATRTVTENDQPRRNGAGQEPAGQGGTETNSEYVSAQNTYTAGDTARPALADRQTVRDIERLFGRPLRVAGATLADQATAVALIADRPLDHFTAAANDEARKDREALEKIAEVVVEVLVSSRPLTVAEISGDKTYTVPDIQATAIRLKDAAILAQASAGDVLGRKPQAARLVRIFDVNDIAEATALALMEDMTLSAK
ncbi:MAG: hypothetical protein PHE83_03310 [Opitutaceae bacterium]|nr:hypothetical protein [Opitutaceae bacterium]